MRIEHSTVQAAPAERFTGEVWVDEIVSGDPSTGQRAMSVRFAPGARTAWHSHPRGQVLRVTEGIGRVQRKGGAVTEIRAGDTVYVEPGEVHWHGAAPHSFMTHLVLQEAGPEDPLIEWLDQVTDAEYQGSSIVREHMVTGDLTGAGDRIDRVSCTRSPCRPDRRPVSTRIPAESSAMSSAAGSSSSWRAVPHRS